MYTQANTGPQTQGIKTLAAPTGPEALSSSDTAVARKGLMVKKFAKESDKVIRICPVKVSRHPAQSSTACCQPSFMFLRHLVLVLHGG